MMRLMWSLPVPMALPVLVDGAFTWHAGKPVYYFQCCGVQAAYCGENGVNVRRIPYPFAPEGVLLSLFWQLREDHDPPLLLLTKQHAINLQTQEIVCHDLPIKKRSSSMSYQLGEYRIDYNDGFSIACTRNGAKAWQFRMQGYLYTPIVQWEDLIFFGTAGYGGYLYILRLETGEVVAAVKTGGTVQIAQQGGVCYVLANRPGARLLKVDMASGSILEELPLPGKSHYSNLRLMDGKVHAITTVFKGNMASEVLWNCVVI